MGLIAVSISIAFLSMAYVCTSKEMLYTSYFFVGIALICFAIEKNKLN